MFAMMMIMVMVFATTARAAQYAPEPQTPNLTAQTATPQVCAEALQKYCMPVMGQQYNSKVPAAQPCYVVVVTCVDAANLCGANQSNTSTAKPKNKSDEWGPILGLIALLPCNAETYKDDPIVDQVCVQGKPYYNARHRKVVQAVGSLTCCLAVFNARMDRLEAKLNAHIAEDDARDKALSDQVVELRNDVNDLKDCHSAHSVKDCHQAIHDEIDDAKKEAMDYTDMMFVSTAFKFDLGAVALGSTDFRGKGIVAGGLRISLDFGATDRFRPVFHGSVGGGHGRWTNVVWEVGTSQEIRVNDRGTVWLGPAITWSHENVLDANFNTFLGAGIALRVLFPESHHGYFSAAIFGGDNMYFKPDKTGEYDEVMAHHFGVGIQLSVGYSIFQDSRKK